MFDFGQGKPADPRDVLDRQTSFFPFLPKLVCSFPLGAVSLEVFSETRDEFQELPLETIWFQFQTLFENSSAPRWRGRPQGRISLSSRTTSGAKHVKS